VAVEEAALLARRGIEAEEPHDLVGVEGVEQEPGLGGAAEARDGDAQHHRVAGRRAPRGAAAHEARARARRLPGVLLRAADGAIAHRLAEAAVEGARRLVALLDVEAATGQESHGDAHRSARL